MSNQPPPLPPVNTRLGFHYFPDEAHHRDSDLQAWLPELRALDVSWLTLIASPSRAIPESFLRGVIGEGFEPIVHLLPGPVRRLDLPSLRPVLQAYARWGVHYVSMFSEPNARESWEASEWGRPGLVERALDAILPVLTLQADLGLVPVFPPLRPGGDYWDTAFLDAALDGLIRRGSPSLLGRLAFGFFGWTNNRPPTWGTGGPARWPNARPYVTTPGTEDHLGFRLPEWYDAAIRARLGSSRPLVCLRGGPRLGDRQDPAFPIVDHERHAALALEVANQVRQNALPSSVLNISFWLLASGSDHPAAEQAWYRPNGSTLPAVSALKGRSTAPSKTSPASAKAASPNGKPLFHYVLLPCYEWGVADWHWNAVREYVKTFRPACGFSVDEAAQAHLVTIVGNEQGVPMDAEAALVQRGCTVERIGGADGAAIEARLIELARSGRRSTLEAHA